MNLSRWIATLAYAGVIFFLSSRQWSGAPLFLHSDKLIHLVIYTGLGALCAWSLSGTSLRGRAQLLPLAAAMAFLYGVTDEAHQMTVPGREASVADLVFDAIGGFLGAWVFVRLSARQGRRDDNTGKGQGA